MSFFRKKNAALKMARTASSKSLSHLGDDEGDVPSPGSALPSRNTSESNLTALDNNAPIFKFGIIQKEGGNVHSWKKRFFIVRPDGVHYYKSIPAAYEPGKTQAEEITAMLSRKPTGTIPLHGSVAAPCPEKEGKKVKNCFQVKTLKRTYFMSCDTAEETDQWIKVIQETIALVTNRESGSGAPLTEADAQQPVVPSLRAESNTPMSGASPSSYQGSPSMLSHTSSFVGSPEVSSAGSASALNNRSNFPNADSAAEGTAEYQRKFSDSDTADRAFGQRQSISGNDLHDISYRASVTSEDGTYMDGPRRSSADYYDESMVSKGRDPFLNEQDEYDIAMCAAEIFMKSPEDRTPEEQAYVVAMNQYAQLLNNHIHMVQKQMQRDEDEDKRLKSSKQQEQEPKKKDSIGSNSDQEQNGGEDADPQTRTKEKEGQDESSNSNSNINDNATSGSAADVNPGDNEEDQIELAAEYGLASGTLIFAIPAAERTETEQEYINDVVEEYMNELRQNSTARYQHIPIDLQVDAAKRAYQYLGKEDQAEDEDPAVQEYNRRVHEVMRDVTKLERTHGVRARFNSLLAGTLILAKPEDRINVEDIQFQDVLASEMKVTP